MSTNPESVSASSTTPSGEPRASIGLRKRTKGRIWAFRIFVLLIAPTLFLAVLEGGLRLVGAGHATGYFQTFGEEGALCGNPHFGWTYFPPDIARMPPPFVLTHPKPSGVTRIFVLGSSAALGFPNPSLSFSRVLEAMLKERFPARRFEVINTAMVAINSHVIARIAEDCAARQPDLFIVYEGNNEVVGPFGPATVFSGFSDNATFIDLQLALARSRLGQVVQSATRRLAGSGAPSEWKGMEFFLDNRVRRDDARLNDVADHFRRNLTRICVAAKDAGAGVMLCTVGVNLRECAPFASEHRPGFTADESARWDRLIRDAAAAQSSGDRGRAAALLREAIALDDAYAETHFHLARLLEIEGDLPAARREYALARDLDTLRFRTDSRLNEVVRAVAAEQGVRLIDIEREFESRPADSSTAQPASAAPAIPGNDLLLEHVHLSFEGNYRIAASLFREIAKSEGGPGGDVVSPIPTREICARRLAYSDWDEYASAEDVQKLLTRPPFTNQSTSALDQQAVRDRLAALAPAMQPAGLERARAVCQEAIDLTPEDAYLHRKMAAICGRLALATHREDVMTQSLKELDIVARLWPFDGASILERSGVYVKLRKFGEALADCDRVLASDSSDRPGRAEAYYNRGLALAGLGRNDDAIAAYESALAAVPSLVQARGNLALLLAAQGRLAEAEAHNRELIRLAPTDFRGHLNLGLVLTRLNQFPAAAAALQEAVRLEPRNADAWVALGAVLIRTGDRGGAASAVNRALELAPNHPTALQLRAALSR